MNPSNSHSPPCMSGDSARRGSLSPNEFYLIVSNFGYVLKTKNFQDFLAVRSWGGFIFEGVVKNSHLLNYYGGRSWHKKKISRLPVSRPYLEVFYYDFSELDTNCSYPISEFKIGGKEIDHLIEQL